MLRESRGSRNTARCGEYCYHPVSRETHKSLLGLLPCSARTPSRLVAQLQLRKRLVLSISLSHENAGTFWIIRIVFHYQCFRNPSDQQSEWSFPAFFAGCLAISVIATALFNRSRGSILLSAFFHFSLMNPVFPDAQPYDTYLLILVAFLIVWWKRDDMLKQEDAVVEVIPHEKAVDGEST